MCLFVIIPNFHVDNVNGFIEVSAPGKKIWEVRSFLEQENLIRGVRILTIANGIKTTLFASYYNVSNGFAILPTFWGQLNFSIAIKHLQ